MASSLTAIILTFNEEKHLERCLRSLAGLVNATLVVDSGSTDGTQAIAARHGARVLVHPWKNYASQFNWALDHGSLDTDWCLRIDADEYLSDTLRASMSEFLARPDPDTGITGMAVRRRIVFMGRSLRWGAMGHLYMLRLFRRDSGRCESRWMDEHIVLDRGRSARLSGDLIDENLNNIGWWVQKHNGYATREAIDLLMGATHGAATAGKAAGRMDAQARLKRFLKHGVYARIPPAIRAIGYFLYRYFVRLGFLDGRAGLVFTVMQALWYRMLVDVKVLEIQARMRADKLSLEDAVRAEYPIALPAAKP